MNPNKSGNTTNKLKSENEKNVNSSFPSKSTQTSSIERPSYAGMLTKPQPQKNSTSSNSPIQNNQPKTPNQKTNQQQILKSPQTQQGQKQQQKGQSLPQSPQQKQQGQRQQNQILLQKSPQQQQKQQGQQQKGQNNQQPSKKPKPSKELPTLADLMIMNAKQNTPQVAPKKRIILLSFLSLIFLFFFLFDLS